MITLLLAVLMFGLTFFFRIYPILGELQRGTDAYVFLMYRDALRKQKRLPVNFPPVFVLEQPEMWYPPGFAVFLALFPNRFLDKYHAFISPFMDGLLNLGLFLFLSLVLGFERGGLLACTLFALSPAIIPEACYMTSRQLGNIFLNTSVLCCLYYVTISNHVGILLLTMLAIYLLLMTHKLSTQAFMLGIPTTALVTGNATLLWLFIAGFTFTIMLSLGFYIKILIGHWSFVHFHSHNWQYLSAHMVEDSPIYGKRPGRNSPYGKGWNKSFSFTNRYLLENAYVVAPFFVVFETLTRQSFSPFIFLCAIWSIAIVFWGMAIYWLPLLRGIGFGSQYGKLAAPAGFICVAACMHQGFCWWVMGGSTAYLAFCAWDYSKFAKRIRGRSQFNKWPSEVIDPTMDFLKSLENPLIFTFPLGYGDLIAYRTHKRVLWGAHNHPTRGLTPVYPVLRDKVENICNDHGVTHILVDTGYTSPKGIDLDSEPVFKADYIEIYQVGG